VCVKRANNSGQKILTTCPWCGVAGDVQLDEALLEQQRAAYAVRGVDESEPAGPTKKKRKNVYVNGEEVRLIPTPLSPCSLVSVGGDGVGH
jgi:hypothetical protein